MSEIETVDLPEDCECCGGCDDDCSQGTSSSWTDAIYTESCECCGDVYFSQSFTNPYDVPALLCITGDADDAVLLNGSRVGDDVGLCMDGWPGGPWSCRCGFSGYTGHVAPNETVLLEIADMCGGGCGMDLQICFVPDFSDL